jgi:hypothetical protein
MSRVRCGKTHWCRRDAEPSVKRIDVADDDSFSDRCRRARATSATDPPLTIPPITDGFGDQLRR